MKIFKSPVKFLPLLYKGRLTAGEGNKHRAPVIKDYLL